VVHLQQASTTTVDGASSEFEPSTGFANGPWALLSGSWSGFSTASNGNLSYEICLGSTPFSCQVMGPLVAPPHANDPLAGNWSSDQRSENTGRRPSNKHLLCGHAYFLAVRAYDCAGFMTPAVSPPLKVCCDRPSVEGVALVHANTTSSASMPYVTPLDELEVAWSKLTDECAGIRDTVAEFVVSGSTTAVAAWSQSNWTAGQRASWSIVPMAALAYLTHGARYRVRLRAISHAGWAAEALSPEFIFDATGPDTGTILEGGSLGATTCYTHAVATAVSVGWQGFVDVESGVSAVQVGLGSSPYALDVLPLQLVGGTSAGSVSLELQGTLAANLTSDARIFATVRAINRAGLSTNTSSSKGFLVLDELAQPAICK